MENLELKISQDEIKEFRESNVGLYGLDLSRISWLLSAQLTGISKYRLFSSFSVTDVIQNLEGRRPTRIAKDIEKFRHPPLNRFFKVHFSDPRFMMRNLLNESEQFNPKSKKFDDAVDEAIQEENNNPSNVGWQGRLAHKLTMDAYTKRASEKRLTGEWLIIGEFENIKYYLGIFNHSKNKREDEEIYSNLKQYCEPEFPFLFHD